MQEGIKTANASETSEIYRGSAYQYEVVRRNGRFEARRGELSCLEARYVASWPGSPQKGASKAADLSRLCHFTPRNSALTVSVSSIKQRQIYTAEPFLSLLANTASFRPYFHHSKTLAEPAKFILSNFNHVQCGDVHLGNLDQTSSIPATSSHTSQCLPRRATKVKGRQEAQKLL